MKFFASALFVLASWAATVAFVPSLFLESKPQNYNAFGITKKNFASTQLLGEVVYKYRYLNKKTHHVQ
jgi:hypothetical protein